jgi:hypothetical protein
LHNKWTAAIHQHHTNLGSVKTWTI